MTLRAPERRAAPLTHRRVVTTASPEFSVARLCYGVTGSTNAPWFSANDPAAYPFRLGEAAVVTHLGWLNGSAAGGNVDIGVYSTSWVRLVSAGSTGGSGNSAWQWVNVTDTALPAGQYYLVMSRDNTTANRCFRWANTQSDAMLAMLGTYSSATDAFPLPDPLTNMALTTTVTNAYVLGMVLGATF